jgi:hypothetical protein
MRAITVDSWEGLIRELYQDDHRLELDRYRSPYVFRGLSNDYPLIPGISRLGHAPEVTPEIERLLLRNFRKYAHHEVEHGISSWHWLAIAQHHGLPTRLIDWTYSPFVAMHFATADATCLRDDGVIWCVNVVDARTWLPRRLRDVLHKEDSNVFTIEMLEDMFRDVWELDAADHGREFLLFFEPPSLSARIINQVALFSMVSPPQITLDQWLRERTGERALVKKVMIPAGLKWEVRDKLDQANVNERVLFPGLDGLSRWLRRWYLQKNMPADLDS